MNDHLPCSGWPEDSTKAEGCLRKSSPRSFLVAHDSDRDQTGIRSGVASGILVSAELVQKVCASAGW